MRRMIAAGVTAFALSGALLAGGGPAAAAPTDSATAVSAQQPSRSVLPGYTYLSWYWTEGNCENNGARLQVRGTIRNFYCEQSPWLTYYLYVKY